MSGVTPELASLVVPDSTAVLVIDMQQVFASVPTLYPPVTEILQRNERFISKAREAGALIIFIQVVIPQELYSENWRRQYRRRHGETTWLAPGSENVQMHPGFTPQPGDIHITKPRYSAFVGTALETILRSNGIRTVIGTGLTTDICVGSTVRDAWQRDFATVTLADCTAEQTQTQYEVALRTLGGLFGVVCDSTDVLGVWKDQRLVAADE